jgi:hypothetical protein
MRPRSYFWAAAGLFLLAGCLPSLNPVYTEDNLVMDPAFVGVWTQPKNQAQWEFNARDMNSYTLVYTDEEGRQGRFIAHVADVQGVRFLDLYPDAMETANSPFYGVHLTPIHTIYLVRQVGPVARLASIDYAWLDKFLTEHPEALTHATFHGRKLITAPTEELQAFVIQYQDKFNAEFELTREPATVN